MAPKAKTKGPGSNPGGSQKVQKESVAEQAKMRDKDRRPDNGSKINKGSRRRAG